MRLFPTVALIAALGVAACSQPEPVRTVPVQAVQPMGTPVAATPQQPEQPTVTRHIVFEHGGPFPAASGCSKLGRLYALRAGQLARRRGSACQFQSSRASRTCCLPRRSEVRRLRRCVSAVVSPGGLHCPRHRRRRGSDMAVHRPHSAIQQPARLLRANPGRRYRVS